MIEIWAVLVLDMSIAHSGILEEHIFSCRLQNQRVGKQIGADGVQGEICADMVGCSACTLQHCLSADTAV